MQFIIVSYMPYAHGLKVIIQYFNDIFNSTHHIMPNTEFSCTSMSVTKLLILNFIISDELYR